VRETECHCGPWLDGVYTWGWTRIVTICPCGHRSLMSRAPCQCRGTSSSCLTDHRFRAHFAADHPDRVQWPTR
jgi:hypothetical protein